MKRLIWMAIATAFLLQAFDRPNATGDWLGALNVNGTELRLLLHLKESDGHLSGTLDSLDQSALGIPASDIQISGQKIHFLVPSVHGSFDGSFDETGQTIKGDWKQGPGVLPLVLQRQSVPFTEDRPQEPKPPFPYLAEEVSYPNPQAPGVTLAGTFTKPAGAGPFPAVLLITGSGPQDRDETILGHKPFLVIADYLTRHGIAVLRVDDRSFGKSTGNFKNATTADFATDTEAGVHYLLGRVDVDKKHVGLLGHSEGATIAPIVAARIPQVSFIVLLAGSGVPGDQLLERQVYQIALASGVPAGQADAARSTEHQLLHIVLTEKDPAQQTARIEAMFPEGPTRSRVLSGLAAMNSPWFRYFLAFDPAPTLAQVKCPVLALNGARDTQVSAEQNIPAIGRALSSGGNKDVTTQILPELNHLFQHCTSGSPSEYNKIAETIAPQVLETITAWIGRHSR